MSNKFINANKVSSGLSLTSASPTDDRMYFDSLAALNNFISKAPLENKGSIMHDGIKIMISSKPVSGGGTTLLVTDYTEYVWVETSSGLLDEEYTYSAYAGNMANRKYNFVPASSSVVINRKVPAGDTLIRIEYRYLPISIRRHKVSNVSIFESYAPGKYNIAFPDSIEFEAGTQDLIINISMYALDTDVKIKLH